MTLITIYALFFDDIRILAFHKDYDDLFYGITAASILLFTIEIILSSFAKPDYPFHFFFYLDIISTISMVPDCGWIWDLIITDGSDNENATDLAKASRAGRVTRVIRVIRLIRLIRIVKLYKQTVIAQRKANEYTFNQNKNKGSMLKGLEINRDAEINFEKLGTNEDLEAEADVDSDASDQFFTEESSESSGSEDEIEEDIDIPIPEESKISKTLSDNTTRTVIILVLSLLIMQSVCNTETYIQPVLVHTQAFMQLMAFYDLKEEYWPSYQLAHK